MAKLLIALLAACGPTVVYYTPSEVTTRYTLSGWPLNRLEVQVVDERPNKPASSALPAALKASIEKSLSAPILNPGDKLTLKVTVEEIVAKLDGGRWKAEARVSGILTDVWGKSVANYAGRGQFAKTDTLGRRSGELACEEAVNEAVRQLLKVVDGAPLPVTKAP